MKINSNTTVEEVKEKTRDSLEGLCNIKNDESDNGKTVKELFDTYRTGRLSTSKKSFSEYDFIRLFLSTLLKKGIIKFDSVNLGYRLIDFYRIEEYHDLFDMPVVKQIEGDYLDMSSCLNNAHLGGLISSPVQGTYTRLILIPDADEIINKYSEEYKGKMNKLVDNYLLQQEKMITPSGLVIEDVCTDDSKNFQTFSCGDIKVTFDNNGYIVKAKGFTSVMWSTQNQDEELIGKHIIELAKILKKYAANQENYISFLENVVLKLYEMKTKDNITKNCRTCQNMSCRVESSEKPVEDCLGYIHHEESGPVLTKRKQVSNENN